jgi:AAA15 family ATPase/GTPase
MKIKIKNLGILKEAEFTLGDFTIICGGNNTGKTYATYALFGFLLSWKQVISINVEDANINQLLTDGVIHLDISQYGREIPRIVAKGCQEYTQLLPRIFAAPENRFKNTEFQVQLTSEPSYLQREYQNSIGSANVNLFSLVKTAGSADFIITLLAKKETSKIPNHVIKDLITDALKDILFGDIFPSPFIASAERTGTAIFRKELNFARNRLLEQLSQSAKDIDLMEVLFKGYDDYPLPIKSNVEFTRNLETIFKHNSFIIENNPDLIKSFAEIIGGDYLVTQNDELYYIPQGKRVKISMDESSSAVRSLLDIGFYLKHIAQPGNLLMIDEPELNLHPENQRRIARILARLVNLGVRVFVTTHSDYLIKELNTLIMLNQDKPYLKEIAANEGYISDELLSADRLKVYIAEAALLKLDGKQKRTRCQTLTPADISPELGIEVKSFDRAIADMNRIQEQIIWGE